jgi:hypothetical protein
MKTYILPISTYGLEIVIPKGKILDDIQNYYKKLYLIQSHQGNSGEG